MDEPWPYPWVRAKDVEPVTTTSAPEGVEISPALLDAQPSLNITFPASAARLPLHWAERSAEGARLPLPDCRTLSSAIGFPRM